MKREPNQIMSYLDRLLSKIEPMVNTHQISDKKPTIEIKKYPNRRLYNTTKSAYITLADLSDIIRTGHKVIITDAKTGEDLTSSTLLQLISESHDSSAPLLSARALWTLIAYDTKDTKSALSTYVNKALAEFDALHQENGGDETAHISDADILRDAMKQLNDAFAKWDK